MALACRGQYPRSADSSGNEAINGLHGTLHYRDNITTGETTDYVRMGSHTVGRMDAAGTFTWTHSDHLGSASAATDGAGATLWTESYTPFGEVLQDPLQNRDEAGFTGHVRDAATGLTYAQARFYDPVTSRFHSPDPVGFAGGGPGYFNRYAYTMNDPVNATDPTGMAKCPGLCGTVRNDPSMSQATEAIAAATDGAIEGAHTALDAAGLFPVAGIVPDALNAGLYLAQGDLKGAGLSRAAMVPAAGQAVGGARLAAKGADFIVSARGTAVGTSQSQMRSRFDAAGFESYSTLNADLLPNGVAHRMPDGMLVRTMEPNANAGRRASFENPNGQPVSMDGNPVQPPGGLSRSERRNLVRTGTHIRQDP